MFLVTLCRSKASRIPDTVLNCKCNPSCWSQQFQALPSKRANSKNLRLERSEYWIATSPAFACLYQGVRHVLMTHISFHGKQLALESHRWWQSCQRLSAQLLLWQTFGSSWNWGLVGRCMWIEHHLSKRTFNIHSRSQKAKRGNHPPCIIGCP